MTVSTSDEYRKLITPGSCVACHSHLCQLLPADRRDAAQGLLELNRGSRLEAVEGGGFPRLWNIVRGVAAITTLLADGRRQVIGLHYPGDTVWAPEPVGGTIAWLEAQTDCWICQIDTSAASHAASANEALQARLFTLVQRQLEEQAARIVTLGRLDGYERLCLYLGELASRIGRPMGREILISLPMSRADIGDYLGLNAETVSRILARIRKDGLVKFVSPTQMIIPDLARLEKAVPIATPGQRQAARLRNTATSGGARLATNGPARAGGAS
ncbi:MAG: Crp/Fnr family transcriptional regulator [Rhodobacteraceae bacterium]|nr:Crp/Fnr family transcriptional regulator [Paracoccaceae bacterium]